METNERFVVGFNTPGCLPEMEPYAVDGLVAAQAALISELEECHQYEYEVLEADEESTEALDEEYRSAVEAVESWGGRSVFLVLFSDYAFWADFADADAEEEEL